MDKYTIIKDTREQQGWAFAKDTSCDGMLEEKLDTGDYSLKGYEDVLTIERKASTSEFAGNIVDPRFERELCRMDELAHSFLILEFTMDDVINFPVGSGIPPYLWKKLKTTSAFMLKKLLEYQLNHKCQIILAGKHGKKVASSIFKRFLECQPK